MLFILGKLRRSNSCKVSVIAYNYDADSAAYDVITNKTQCWLHNINTPKNVQTGNKRHNIEWNGTESRNPKINVVPMLFVGAFHRIVLKDEYCK